MKTLTYCPKCHDPLLSQYIREVSGSIQIWNKKCISHIDHRFAIHTRIDNDNELQDMEISITMIPYVYAIWYFKTKILHIRKTNNIGEDLFSLVIPYFDPEPYMNDYNKLIIKLKTFMTFS